MRRFIKEYWWITIVVAFWVMCFILVGPRKDKDGNRPQDVARIFIDAVQAQDFEKAADYWREGDVSNVEANWELTFAEFCTQTFRCETYRLYPPEKDKVSYVVNFEGQEHGVAKAFSLYLRLVDGKWRLCMPRWFNFEFTPTELTRFQIKRCEDVESKVLADIDRSISTNVNQWFVPVLRTTDGYALGVVKLSNDETPLVLDAWDQPLQMMFRVSLAGMPNASESLLGKTNTIIIWSMGVDGVNEFGNGDDVFLKSGETWDSEVDWSRKLKK